MGGRGGSSGVRPGAAEEENGFRKRKPAATPGVSLRGRSGKVEPRKESRAQSSVPAPERKRQPVDELLHEELWQLNPEENEPRTQAGY
ncbi:hypothetical protein FPZ12_029155 [Amycolatopsis acidicola]|uniref:Uncharacterized protein n=1 Tax=Amycolatopsis acidicola TaxID=2596893 RepID=A0A5N0UVG0_9PSEU|nr:hypothetical protein FPZ12_029155 [Amycolatopsis acidicola]